MCIVVAKYNKDLGWMIAKNRDQGYVAKGSIICKTEPKVDEILYLYDREMYYKEGINAKGLTIITASLTPVLAGERNKYDGQRIYEALHLTDPEEAAKYLVKSEVSGVIFCATADKLVLAEGARKNKDGEQAQGDYVSKIRIVPKSETVVATNHGLSFSWAGFQKGYNEKEDMWAESSRTRQKDAKQNVKDADTPEELLNALAKWSNKNTQMNVFRIENEPREMRTLFQLAIVPSELKFYARPIQTKLRVQVPEDSKIVVELMDNQIVKKIYSNRIKHLTKVDYPKKDGNTVDFNVEGFLGFRDYIETVL